MAILPRDRRAQSDSSPGTRQIQHSPDDVLSIISPLLASTCLYSAKESSPSILPEEMEVAGAAGSPGRPSSKRGTGTCRGGARWRGDAPLPSLGHLRLLQWPRSTPALSRSRCLCRGKCSRCELAQEVAPREVLSLPRGVSPSPVHPAAGKTSLLTHRHYHHHHYHRGQSQ